MKIKKNLKYGIAILSIIVIFIFLPIVFETYNTNADPNIMDSPKISSSQSWITITDPTNETSWGTGTGHWIYWHASGDIFTLNVTLFENSTFVQIIDDSSPNSGVLLWNIPEDLEESTLYQLKIENRYNQSTYDISPFFEIYKGVYTPPIELGALAPIIVLTGFGLLIFACVITKVVKRIVISKKRE